MIEMIHLKMLKIDTPGGLLVHRASSIGKAFFQRTLCSIGAGHAAIGVETEAQRVFLQAAGCDLLQGYLFSRPVTADSLLELVRRHQ